MTERETMIRSVLFLVIGILLLLSLVICVYIVSSERDLVKTEADVLDVTKDVDGTGNNVIKISYDAAGINQNTEINYKDDVNVDDKITIYYHENNVKDVKTNKTSKLIFICPAIGLVLCVFGLFELFRKDHIPNEEEEFKTSVINVVDNTQQLKIVTDNTSAKEYVKTPEEKVETEVRTIKKVEQKPVASSPIVSQAVSVTPKVVDNTDVMAKKPVPVVNNNHQVVQPQQSTKTANAPKPELPVTKPVEKNLEKPSTEVTNKVVVQSKETKPLQNVESAVLKKVQNSSADGNGKVSLNENEIKDVIRDVLKEVLQEVKEEKEPPKKVEQRRVLPNYYYISGTSLIYVEPGKESKEIELKTIKKVVRTINSEGNVVKLVVSNDEIKCILTNMKNIDLEQVANLLHNKMRTIDENFNEEIEHKEY